MTLKTRNRFITAFLISSLITASICLIIFITAIFRGTIIMPPGHRIFRIMDNIPLMKNSFTALLISFLLIILYVPVCFYLLLKYFENTQTSEIIFFTGFLLACLAEAARFLTICLGLWQTFSNMLIFAGNMVLFGRTLAPLSFLCASILSENELKQDVERNYLIMMTVSLVFAAIIPMNTARIASTGLVTEGFRPLIMIFRTLLMLTAVVSFYIQGTKKNSREQKHLSSSSFILLLGYSMLISADNLPFLIFGSALLFLGTYRYLVFIHKLYMWNYS